MREFATTKKKGLLIMILFRTGATHYNFYFETYKASQVESFILTALDTFLRCIHANHDLHIIEMNRKEQRNKHQITWKAMWTWCFRTTVYDKFIWFVYVWVFVFLQENMFYIRIFNINVLHKKTSIKSHTLIVLRCLLMLTFTVAY